MNILNLIRKENYFAIINKKLQKAMDSKIKNKKTVIKKLGISRMTLYRIRKENNYWCNIKTLLNLAGILEINKKEVMRNILKIKSKNSHPIDPCEIKINKSLARVLGHILGDGGIHVIKKENKFRVFYVNNEIKLLNSFKGDIKRIFGKAKIYFRKREDRGDEIWLSSTIGYVFYILLKYEKNKIKRVPDLIKKSNNQTILYSFLQALYDDEGYIYPHKKMIVIALSNYNLLEDIRKLLKRINIMPNQILIHQPKEKSKMYYFSITGKKEIMKFKEKIDFIHPLKNKKLDTLLGSYKK